MISEDASKRLALILVITNLWISMLLAGQPLWQNDLEDIWLREL